MRIVFLSYGLEIDGNSLDTKPLGGTETALIATAQSLAAHPGVEVLVFTRIAAPAVYSGVHYAPLTDFHRWVSTRSIDVLISIRMWLPFWLPIRVGLRVYFSPDAPDQASLHRGFDVATKVAGEITTVPILVPGYFLDDVDAFFCVGRWQAAEFVSQLGFPANRIFVTANGVRPHAFAPRPLAERHPRMLYSSTPFRGLTHLVRYYPEIKRRFPAAEIEVCSSMTVYGLSHADDEHLHGELYRDLRAAGALLHGSVRQAELHSIMCGDRVFTYPNTYPETFCISVLEAQAAGLPVVTTRRAALAERVADGVDGFLLDGNPGEPAYDRTFVERTVALFTDDGLWHRMSDAAITKARAYTYERVAQSWIAYFADRLKSVEPRLPKIDLERLAPFVAAIPTEPATTMTLTSAELKHLVHMAFEKYFGTA